MLRTVLFLLSILFIAKITHAQHIFNKIDPDEKLLIESKKTLSNVDFYKVNIPALFKKLNTSDNIKLEIPVDNITKTVLLEKVNILTQDYQLYTSSGKTLNTARKYTFYHGSVQGMPNSKVTMIFYDNMLSMSIFDEDGNFEINKQGELYAGYFNHDRKEPIGADWDCQVIEDSDTKTNSYESDARSEYNSDCVTIFFEIDNNMYLKHGADPAATEAWFMTLFLQVSIFYIEHNVSINISGLQIWDTLDPYVSANNVNSLLSLFGNTVHNNPNFNGRLGHLISGRYMGGGIAHLNSLCSSNLNVAVSTSVNGTTVLYPTYSWDVMVVTHELGHNMGSRHTHACVWNGNNTAIDGCGNIEGNCPNPGDPPLNIGGTIMSYCHLSPSGINFVNGFGPQPGALIENKFLTAPCVTGENCAKVTPFNDICDRSKELPVLNYCVKGYFDNYETTPSGDGGNMNCGDTGIENDIWYQFYFGEVDTIHLEVHATDIISDLVVEIYTGDCDNLTSVDCGFSTNGEEISFAFSDPNLRKETLFIRIVEKGSDEEGEFSICLYANDLPCQDQLDTLLNIYQELNGTNWTNNAGWMEGDQNGTCDYCNWYGIQCDYLGQITEINLPSNNLQGKLPQDLVSLKYLKQIRFNNNLLTDTIPNYWDSLSKLQYLDLSYNSLTGSIPTSYTTLKRINTIHLDHNNLEESIPESLGANSTLRTFTASYNLLSGCYPFGSDGFCNKDSVNLTNNPDLPFAGDLALLCAYGWGTDWDNDGYCRGSEDCNDNDPAIHPGAAEILCDAIDNNCNGTIDEGSNFGPNVWIGPDTLGVFYKPSFWSLNHTPLICENVEIGMNGETVDLIIADNGSSNNLKIRNLSIGQSTTLHLPSNYNLSIMGNGVVVNNGTFDISGGLNIQDQSNTLNTAFYNNGSLQIANSGGFNIYETGDIGLRNSSNGIINLFGNSYIATNAGIISKNAVVNEGEFNIFSTLVIYGDFTDEDLINQNGGTINIKPGGYFISF